MENYSVIGLMSGSSLDGVDIAMCQLIENEGTWLYQIIESECIPYSPYWINILKKVQNESALNYHRSHVYLGHYLGQLCKQFISKHDFHVDLIASHGHTVFHNPSKRFTSQIGDGAAIAALTGITTVSDLRTTDVALGGQGAPIVPIGDQHLFKDYKFCLNIGGIANISAKTNDSIYAYDICGANQILNHLAKKRNLEFDNNGDIARSGSINQKLLSELNSLPFFQKQPPKSLSNQWVIDVLPKLLEKYPITLEDKLCTFCEHIAIQVSNNIKLFPFTPEDKLLITGGGAFNSFLIERIALTSPLKIAIPDKNVIKYKEALVMAFIGVLRIRNEVNVLKSVTGSNRNNICGAIYAGSLGTMNQ